jgi:hypothetical protein
MINKLRSEVLQLINRRYRMCFRVKGDMKLKILATIAAAFLATSAYGLPDLQLDVSSGAYGAGETIYNTTDPFTLYALAKTQNLTGTTYYLSIAIVPKQASGSTLPNFGSFVFDGKNYDASSGWLFGTPPVDAIADIPSHGQFPTLFLELSFDELDGLANAYDTQDNPGGFSLYGGVGDSLAYKGFDVNTTGLGEGYALHFDLYTYTDGGAVDAFAPFSHDAQTSRVPDGGSTVILLGTVLAGVGVIRRYWKI